jgi:hypothetical protein
VQPRLAGGAEAHRRELETVWEARSWTAGGNPAVGRSGQPRLAGGAGEAGMGRGDLGGRRGQQPPELGRGRSRKGNARDLALDFFGGRPRLDRGAKLDHDHGKLRVISLFFPKILGVPRPTRPVPCVSP